MDLPDVAYVPQKYAMYTTMEMAEQVKVLAAKPSGLGSIPETHMVEGEGQLPQIVLWPLHLIYGLRVHEHKINV